MRFAPFSRRRGPGPPPAAGEAPTMVADAPGGRPPVVEEEVAQPPPPPPPPPRPLVWPWLLLLLLLVAGGLIAWWLVTRDNDHGHRPAAVLVPRVVGQRQDRAVTRLDAAGLVARVVTKPSSEPVGIVFAQRPHGGARVAHDSEVTVSVSAAETVAVPNVVGRRASAAATLLRGEGLTVVTTSVRSRKPAGTVVAQHPPAGTTLAKGSTVQLRVSRALVLVPDVTGQTRSAAVSTLRAAGLVPSAVRVTSSQPRGTVVAQEPVAGKRVAQGSKVRINVSAGGTTAPAPPPPPPPPPPAPPPPPPPTATSRSVPDVTTQRQESAQRTLNNAGFKSGVVYVPSNEPQGTVVSQAPAGGLTRRRGTRVQLNVSLGPSPGALKVVPGVVGLDPSAARAKLSSAGFNVQTLRQAVSSRAQAGKVVDEQPSGGRRAPARSTVTIYVGRFSG